METFNGNKITALCASERGTPVTSNMHKVQMVDVCNENGKFP